MLKAQRVILKLCPLPEYQNNVITYIWRLPHYINTLPYFSATIKLNQFQRGVANVLFKKAQAIDI